MKLSERCKKLEKAIRYFEKNIGKDMLRGGKITWPEYFAEPLSDEEKQFCETLGYRYIGQGKFSGAFGITDHEFEYIGVAN